MPMRPVRMFWSASAAAALFAGAAFFEGGDHKDGVADARDDEAYEAFAEAPTDSGEVVERSAGGEEERVVFCGLRRRAAGRGRRIGHEVLCVFDALMKFVGSDGVNAVAEWLEGGKREREGGAIRRVGGAGDFRGESCC